MTGSTGQNQSPYACRCNAGLQWNGTSCANSGVNCSAFANSNGQDGTKKCFCNSGYFWNDVECQKITPTSGTDCSKVKNAAGKSGRHSCYCREQYYWDGIQCQIACDIINGSTGVNKDP